MNKKLTSPNHPLSIVVCFTLILCSLWSFTSDIKSDDVTTNDSTQSNITVSLNTSLSNYPDSTLYWTIVCQNRDDQYCYINTSGQLVPMDTMDNNQVVGSAKNCNGRNTFANYSTSLAQSSTITLDAATLINSAILYISVDNFLPICVQEDSTGHISYAPPSFENPSLQGYDMIFQAFEFAYNITGNYQFNINTTNVDEVGIAAQLSLTDTSGTKTVGFTQNREYLIKAFDNCVDTNFSHLLIKDNNGTTLRILSPEHAIAGVLSNQNVVDYFASFYTDYIDRSWNAYEGDTITVYNSSQGYTGYMIDSIFYFNKGDSVGMTEFKFAQPSSDDVMSAHGEFIQGNDDQKNVGKVLAAAIYRTVFLETPKDSSDSWCGKAAKKMYFKNTPINYYSTILHDNSLDNLCYSYAYSDVCNESSSLVSWSTQKIEIKLLD